MGETRTSSVGVRVFRLVVLTGGPLVVAGCMSLHTAAGAGNVDEVRRQLAWGANPNARTFWYLRTPMHEAAAYAKNVEIGRILLEHGADPALEYNGRPVAEEFLKALRQDPPTDKP